MKDKNDNEISDERIFELIDEFMNQNENIERLKILHKLDEKCFDDLYIQYSDSNSSGFCDQYIYIDGLKFRLIGRE